MTQEEAKQKLITSGRILARHGHGDMTRGHPSVRMPGQSELFFMKAHSLGLDEITVGNILLLISTARLWPARPGGIARCSSTARSTAPGPVSRP